MEAAHTRRYLQALLVPSTKLPPPSSIGTAPRQGGISFSSSSSSSSAASASASSSGRAARTSTDDGETSSGASGSNSDAEEREGEGEGGGEGGDASRNNKDDETAATTPTAPFKDGIDSSSNSEAGATAQWGRSTTGSSAGSRETAVNHVDVEARIRKVIELLADDDLLEEDKPEKLKEMLPDVTAGTESSNLDVDAIVLAILHRYREDVAPTGQIFNSPTPLPRPAGGLSRSSSFRRTLTPTSAGSLALKRSGIATPTRPISPSPLRPHSPSMHGPRTIDPFTHHLGDSSFSSSRRGPGSSAPSSPFGSPRMLNAGASEFRPNPASAEFKPGPPSLSVRMPEVKTRSPIGTPLTEASPTLWAFQNSPLGTPKFATGSAAAATVGTTGSYFGNIAPRPSTPTAHIPSDPWNTASIPSTTSSSSIPGISHSTSTASSESSHEEGSSFDPFGNNNEQPQQVSAGKSQILSSEDEDEWGIPSTTYEEAARRTAGKQLGDADSPSWNLYDDEEDDEDLAMLSFQGGKLVPDDLTLVEPPNKQRPIFDEHYQPQSTSQYSQLPQDQAGWNAPAGADVHTPTGIAGLGASTSNYVMTPFDVLYSIFAGSDIQAADLEEALSRSGWDVDKAMEWIINNPRLPGVPRQAEGQVDHLNMLGSLDLNDRSPMVGGGLPSPRIKGPLGSGSRPLVISRDSFQRNLGAMGRPASPRWASGPTTPGGRSDRSGDGYFVTAPGTGPINPSTRLCKYYLQGNCLRSDCRFSHDLSKAVCKFWLRGHCLKGEGRCEFLHSVPPHLAQDVAALRANAMRSRDQEKTRWNGRAGEDDDGQGRAEDDFPSLAAATASARQASMAGPLGQGGKDPSTSRWAGIVKNGRPVAQLPVNSRPSLPRAPSSSARIPGRGGERSAPFSQPRPSTRLALRPPTLLPTVSTGAAVSRMYEQYRQQFFEYGNARNKCLVKAAACFRAGDGAGAKRWSREAQDWNKQIADEGTSAAENIVSERRKLLKEAVFAGHRQGVVDGTVDRQYRGQECGNGLGVCLGVAAAGEALGPEGARLSAAERTEVAIDLHGLHPSEGVEILERFLLGLASEGVMRGLCFVLVGQERHTGTADPSRGSRKLRLIDAVGQWLDSYGYAFWLVQGILAIDPYL